MNRYFAGKKGRHWKGEKKRVGVMWVQFENNIFLNNAFGKGGNMAISVVQSR